nr:putative reverse transcriptase domain-containing protein [Tanacetum cinerariifolium]
MTLQSSIKDKILASQEEASDESAGLYSGLDEMIEHGSDGALYYLDQIWVPLKGDMRTLIMDEAHKSKYYIHLGADKMYYDLRYRYLWPRIKKDIVVYVSMCLTCLKVKPDHLRPSGLLQQLEILEWKYEKIAMDFVTKLSRTCDPLESPLKNNISNQDTQALQVWSFSKHLVGLLKDVLFGRAPFIFDLIGLIGVISKMVKVTTVKACIFLHLKV